MPAVKLTDSIYYIQGDTNVGAVVCNGGFRSRKTKSVYLIDSGMNSKDAERIYGELEALFPKARGGFKVKAVINTHSHADHSGGNAFFTEKTGCQIWISEIESAGLLNPMIHGAIFSMGNPIIEMRIPYFIQKVSRPTRFVNEKTVIKIAGGKTISFTSLPGHSFDMLGVVITDRKGRKVLFAGDAFFGSLHIMRYWIPYVYDLARFKETLEKLDRTEMDWYVPSHGEAVTRINETVELNQIALLSTEYCIIQALKKHKKLSEDVLIKEIADMNDIRFRIVQYNLIMCTLKSYLTYLYDMKKIEFTIEDNIMYWKLTEEPDVQEQR